MKPFLSMLFLFTVACTSVRGQLETSWWYFGNGCGLHFSGGAPTAASGSAMFAGEGSCSVSDKTTGALLFYSDGITVYDASHTPMPNGTGLMAGLSSTQSCIVIPDPGSTTRYYLFTTGHVVNGGANGLRYNIIDMTLNGGMGDVVAGSKNILLFAPCSEQLSAVKHANCTDWWIMAKGYANNKYFAYQVTPSGILAPVITTIGGSSVVESWGQSKFSPDGTKYAISLNGSTGLFDFDNSTGVISNLVPLVTGSAATYGLSFSGDNSKLYVFQDTWATELYQYDLSSGVPDTIIASATHIGTCSIYGSLQLAWDQKIYIANYNTHVLSVINNPNVAGTGCNLSIGAVTIPGTCWLGLPNFPDSYFDLSSPCPGVTIGNSPISCNGFSDGVVWANVNNMASPYTIAWTPGGSSADTLSNLGPGTYTVTVTDALGYTFVNLITLTDPPALTINSITESDSVCQGAPVTLTVIPSGGTTPYSYQWSTAQTATFPETTFIPDSSAFIFVDVTDANGCSASDSVFITVIGMPTLTATGDTCICSGASATLTAAGTPSYSWSTGETTAGIVVSPRVNTTYIVSYTYGPCTVSDSVFVCNIPSPSVNIHAADSVCTGDTVTFVAEVSSVLPVLSYNWFELAPNSSLSHSLIAAISGYELLVVTNSAGCVDTATTFLTVLARPGIVASNDTCICTGESVLLKASGTPSCNWNTGEVTATIIANPTVTTTYIVTYDNGGCSDHDTVTVCVNPIPLLVASADTVIAFEDDAYLHVTADGPFVWLPSNSLSCNTCPDPVAHPFETTAYTVSSTNGFGCTTSDTVTVTVEYIIEIPNIITPNGDGINDNFRIVSLPKGSYVGIFNRWGNLLHESSNYAHDWSAQTPGVYYYAIRIPTGKTFTGFFHVVY